MNDIKIGSLFDGSAGFPLAAVMNGMTAVWASEVEPYPIRVTTKRLPFMKHYGDISQMNGALIEPVDVITGGSPCQDMSVAGKRVGLDGERSGLFRQQIRIIKEMREASDGKYPRFMVWENVPGALSSNKGNDFKCVLEETARIKDPTFSVPIPAKGKWNTAGLIVGEGFSIGWRILDAQYWGVPQRRRRIFLVADFGGTSSKEILFEREGLSRNFKESREAWQTTPRSFASSFDETSRNPIYSISRGAISAGYEFDCKPGIDETETAYTLIAGGPGGVAHPLTYEWHNQDSRITVPIDTAYTLNTQAGGREGHLVCDVPMTMQIRCGCEGGGKGALIQENKSATLSTHNNQTLFCMATQQGGAEIAENMSPTITAAAGMSGNNQPVLCISRTHGVSISEDVVQTIQAAAGESGNNQPMICEPIKVIDQGGGKSQCNVMENLSPTLTCTHQGEPVVCEPILIQDQVYSLQGNMIGRSDENGPQGSGINENVNFTLNATDIHGVCFMNSSFGGYQEGIGTLKACGGDYGGGSENLAVTYSMTTGSFMQVNKEVSPTLAARDYKDPTCVNAKTVSGKEVFGTLAASMGSKQWLGNQEAFSGDYHIMEQDYIVRRLTPLECARLQGFPDWWTADLDTREEDITEEMMEFWREVFETHRRVVTGATKPKTDKQIKKWLMDPNSDSAEYKMWGNGVALPCVLYIMEGVAEVLRE